MVLFDCGSQNSLIRLDSKQQQLTSPMGFPLVRGLSLASKGACYTLGHLE